MSLCDEMWQRVIAAFGKMDLVANPVKIPLFAVADLKARRGNESIPPRAASRWETGGKHVPVRVGIAGTRPALELGWPEAGGATLAPALARVLSSRK